eukprot:TRINITY_DN773113_c0_g1_i1.p1 TRINITY_DN773113_c0_g1~~TRINITY_DN773113_c0_g1_i1.p1  ORF type:complete len:177 (-),score=19.86 TRINITY_DN773113_c0_g1_i1:68-598(-)
MSVSPINRIKIISCGEAGVGKSCLIKRYCEGKFVSRYISTIGVDFGVKPVEILGKEVRVNFWDLAGHNDFFEVRNEFYKDTHGGILVFDVANPASFTKLEKWIQEATKYGADLKSVQFAICANKSDKKCQVDMRKVHAFADKYGYQVFETSAYTGDNVDEMFLYLFESVSKRIFGW